MTFAPTTKSIVITYTDDDGRELEAVEVYRGCPIFREIVEIGAERESWDYGDWFWISDSGRPVFWSFLENARKGLDRYRETERAA